MTIAKVAKLLAQQAQILRGVVAKSLFESKGTDIFGIPIDDGDAPIWDCFRALKSMSPTPTTVDSFADAFAQTVSYFVVFGIHEHVPPICVLFLSVSCPEVQDQIRTLQDICSQEDIKRVFRDEVEESAPQRKKDQIIHFYEPFLKEYDPEIKRQRGVFYTPWQVVSYIVRSVHEVLQTEFGLEDGLADVATWGEMAARIEGLKIPAPLGVSDRFVTILDPATGTGTFLVECVEVICSTMKTKWRGLGWGEAEVVEAWNAYVPTHLIPRLHGFELLVAPYAVAHLKLRMKLAETGYRFDGVVPELRVFLTNALEPGEERGQMALPGTVDPIADEARAANAVKVGTRFTVVVGNPPYSNFGGLNRGKFVSDLLVDYKRGLNEQKTAINDDCIKFIRFAQYLLATAGAGISGMITSNAYLDGITHRAMRKSLLSDYSVVRIVNLHGSSPTKRAELSPDGSVDENIFPIEQGVGISLFLRRANQKSSPTVFHADVWGNVHRKFHILNTTTTSQGLEIIAPKGEQLPFVPRCQGPDSEYENWPTLAQIFCINGNAVKTDRDALFIDFDRDTLVARMKEFFSNAELSADFVETFRVEDSSSYKLLGIRAASVFDETCIRPIQYRPFDLRWIYYRPGITSRPAWEVMQHLIEPGNVGLLACRQLANQRYFCVGSTRGLAEISSQPFAPLNVFPLHLATTVERDLGGSPLSRDNITSRFYARMEPLVTPMALTEGQFASAGQSMFAYIYAILHSPTYRTRYVDFFREGVYPRIPYPNSANLAMRLAAFGRRLVTEHGVGMPAASEHLPTKPVSDLPKVEDVIYENGTVWLSNDRKFGFHGIPEEVWEFKSGAYQVCKKWLDDRRKAGRTLSPDDITHYQKIITAITETIRIMTEIDAVIEAHGGWPAAFLTVQPPVEP